RLDPVREQDAHGAGLVPGAERVRAVEPRVVAGQRPDPPTEAGHRPALALVQEDERVLGEEPAERLVRRGPRDAPAHEPPEPPGLRQAKVTRGVPEHVGPRDRTAAVARAHHRPGDPVVERLLCHLPAPHATPAPSAGTLPGIGPGTRDTRLRGRRRGFLAAAAAIVLAAIPASAVAVTRDGTRLADTLRGTPGNDVLRGHGSRDQLFGGAGNDLLSGGSASDRLFAEAGDDELDGASG